MINVLSPCLYAVKYSGLVHFQDSFLYNCSLFLWGRTQHIDRCRCEGTFFFVFLSLRGSYSSRAYPNAWKIWSNITYGLLPLGAAVIRIPPALTLIHKSFKSVCPKAQGHQHNICKAVGYLVYLKKKIKKKQKLVLFSGLRRSLIFCR